MGKTERRDTEGETGGKMQRGTDIGEGQRTKERSERQRGEIEGKGEGGRVYTELQSHREDMWQEKLKEKHRRDETEGSDRRPGREEQRARGRKEGEKGFRG